MTIVTVERKPTRAKASKASPCCCAIIGALTAAGFMLVGCSDRSTKRSPTVATTGPQGMAVSYPTFGVTLTMPIGWVETDPKHERQLCSWIRREGGFQTGHLQFDVSPMKEGMANTVAKVPSAYGLKASDESLTLGGGQAAVFRGSLTAGFDDVVWVTENNGHVYIISIRLRQGQDWRHELASIAQGVQWTNLGPPVEHLDLDKRARTIIKDKLWMCLPRGFQRWPETDGVREASFRLRDFAAEQDVIWLDVRFAPIPPSWGRQYEEVFDEFSRSAQGRFRVTSVPTFVRLPSKPLVFAMEDGIEADVKDVDEELPTDAKDVDGELSNLKVFLRYAIIFLNDQEFAILTWTTFDTLPQRRPAYSEMIRNALVSAMTATKWPTSTPYQQN